MDLVISQFLEDPAQAPVEVVERKGLGHPDSICDGIAEAASAALSRFYRERFNQILHHNLDKALLVAGRAEPAFGGGDLREPMTIIVAGRATGAMNGRPLPIADLVENAARQWLGRNLRALDARRQVHIETLVRPGSVDLATLFGRGSAKRPLANDSSVGVGHAPATPLESLITAIERRLNAAEYRAAHPAQGEDVKVLGIRRGHAVTITVARAFIGLHLADLNAYLLEKAVVMRSVREIATELGWPTVIISVNPADLPDQGSIYLTVTGTSAEGGDDGQVGRGNRANGLITPCQPMSLEAIAGKNPVSHVGKLYNIAARRIAQDIVAEVLVVRSCRCLMVGQIGRPIDDPLIVDIRLAVPGNTDAGRLQPVIAPIVERHLGGFAQLTDELVDERISVF